MYHKGVSGVYGANGPDNNGSIVSELSANSTLQHLTNHVSRTSTTDSRATW